MTRINLNFVLLGSMIAYISYILYSDTGSIHGLPSIPSYIITILLIIVLLFISLPILLYTSDGLNDKLIRFALILAILASVLSAMNFGLNVYLYVMMLFLINTIFAMVVFEQNRLIMKLYAATIFILTINLISYALLENTSQILAYTIIAFEFISIYALIHYTYQIKPSIPIILIASFTAFGATILANFILTKDVSTLILTIVIDQLLGISLYSFDFLGIVVSKNIFFIFHFAEFAFLGSILILKRKNIAVWNIVLTGLDVSYPPVLALRIVAFSLLIYREKEGYLDFATLTSTNEVTTWPLNTKK